MYLKILNRAWLFFENIAFLFELPKRFQPIEAFHSPPTHNIMPTYSLLLPPTSLLLLAAPPALFTLKGLPSANAAISGQLLTITWNNLGIVLCQLSSTSPYHIHCDTLRPPGSFVVGAISYVHASMNIAWRSSCGKCFDIWGKCTFVFWFCASSSQSWSSCRSFL